MNIMTCINKVIYKIENTQFHLYEEQEQVQLVLKKTAGMSLRAEKKKNILHFEIVERFSISGLGLGIYTFIKSDKM